MSKLLATSTHQLFTNELIEVLNSKGIRTTLQFLEIETKKLVDLTCIPHKDILEIKNHIINKTAAVSRNALNYSKELIKKSAIIPTGIKNLDNFLQGGLVTGKIYELCGFPSSGKTQLCLTLCKNISQNLKQHVYYIDTKRDFSAKRISMMCNQLAINTGEVLLRILVKKCETKFDVINSLYKIQQDLLAGLKLRIIIIDSLPAVFTRINEYNVENNIYLNHMVNILRYLITECHVVVIVVNLLMAWNEGDFKNQILHEKIACGKYWRNVPHTRLHLKINNDMCNLSVMKSSDIPLDSKCHLKITEQGVI